MSKNRQQKSRAAQQQQARRAAARKSPSNQPAALSPHSAPASGAGIEPQVSPPGSHPPEFRPGSGSGGSLRSTIRHTRPREASWAAGGTHPIPAEIDAVTRAVDMILADGATLSTEFNFRAMIRRVVPKGDPRPVLRCEVSSKGTSAWIARLLYAARLPQLGRRDESQALIVLEGLAQEHFEPMDLSDTVEEDPVAHILGLFLDLQGTWSGTATDLREMLMNLGQRSDTFDKSHPGWPRSPAMLTRRLKELAVLLEDMGIIHETHRDGWSRTHTFTRVGYVAENGEAAQNTPVDRQASSPQSSFVSPTRNGCSAAHDDTDAIPALPEGMDSAAAYGRAADIEEEMISDDWDDFPVDRQGIPLVPEYLQKLQKPIPARKPSSSQVSSSASSFVTGDANRDCGLNDDAGAGKEESLCGNAQGNP